MKVLITGADGFVARSLRSSATRAVDLVALPRQELDIRDASAVRKAIGRHRPDVVINAAAWTACDLAESQPDLARSINAEGVANLAGACASTGGKLVQISTDYVFDGSQTRPYLPDDSTAPVNVYGQTKLEGEQAALSLADALVIRTAWVYGTGRKDFLTKIMQRLAEHAEVPVVSDQIGTPTHVANLANAIWALVMAGATGVHHFTDGGSASWFDFAAAIRSEALTQGLFETCGVIVPIHSIDYPAPAKRPAYSVLDKSLTWRITGTPPDWRKQLAEVLELRRCGKNAPDSPISD